MGRNLYKQQDGTIFGDKIQLMLLAEDGYSVTMTMEPDTLYHPLLTAVTRMKKGGDASAQKLAGLLRVTLKGALLLYGDKVLELFYGTQQHPTLAKGEDVIDFYGDQFVRLLLTWLVKQDIIVEGRVLEGEDNAVAIERLLVTPLKDPTVSSLRLVEPIEDGALL